VYRRSSRDGVTLPRLSYVLPVHNDAEQLPAVLARLVERLDDMPGSEVILVENGSTDGSAATCARLAGEYESHATRIVVTESAKGLGNAMRRGLELVRGDHVCLTASDLPFGFTDLDKVLQLQPLPALAIGSKGHPDSDVSVSALRATMSAAFRLLRRALLGLRAADTQGTLFLNATLAQSLQPRLRCEDFLITTEIVCWAARLGVTAVEVPVVYRASGRSTVSPLRDSLRMAAGMVALRRRIGATARGEASPQPV